MTHHYTEETSQADGAHWTRRFFAIWGGQAGSLLGSALVEFALIWWLTARTESGTVLTLAMLAAAVPRVLIGPFAGALVDRWNRRRVMIAADAGVALATAVLAGLFAAGVAQVWQIYLILFVRAVGGAFHWPAMAASTTLMVPKRHLARIGGINQALNGAMTVIAPPLGALLIEVLPMGAVLAIDVSTAALAILPLLVFSVPQPDRAPSGALPDSQAAVPPSAWRAVRADFAVGLRYVRDWPGLRVLLIMAMAITFCLAPAGALLPLLVKTHFDGGALQLAWVQSGFGAGVIAGGLLLGVWSGFRRRIATSMTGLIGMGAAYLVLGNTPGSALGVGIAALVVAGLMEAIHGGSLFAALQSAVDPALQGRVLALVSSLTAFITPVSLIIAGPLSDTFGAAAWYRLGGVLCMALGLFAFSNSALMGLEDQPRAIPQHEPA